MSERAKWQSLATLEPPLGAKRRVLANIEDSRAAIANPGRRRRLWLLAPVALLGLAAMAIITVAAGDGSGPPAASTPAPSPRLRLAANDQIAVTLSAADVVVHGPAELAVKPEEVVVGLGLLEVDGDATIAAPMCVATIAGRADVEVTTTSLQVRVFAGSAEVSPESAQCAVEHIELAAASPSPSPTPSPTPSPSPTPIPTPMPSTTPSPSPSPNPNPTPTPSTTPTPTPSPSTSPSPTPSPSTSTSPSPTPTTEQAPALRATGDSPPAVTPTQTGAASELRRQVEAFRHARRLRGRDDRAALAAWRAMAIEWPSNPMSEEVDLAIVELLFELGPGDEARAAAAAFLARYPRSAHRAAVRRLLQEQQ